MFKKLLSTLAIVLGLSVGLKADVWVGGAGAQTDVTRNNKLVWVYNSDTVAHENGDVVVWFDGTTDGLEVSTTTTANSKLVAGVVYPNTIEAQTWGSVMIYGYHPAVTIGVANAAGDCLGTSTTGEATGITTTADACVATALEATTSSTTVKAFVHRM